MKNLISKKYKHLLWQDELHDPFLLTKTAEIYEFDENTLGVYVWSNRNLIPVVFKRARFDEWLTDDHILVFKTPSDNLEEIIKATRPFKKRPYIKGNWIKQKELLLGHKILPYRPELKP